MRTAATILSLQWRLLRRRYSRGVESWLGLAFAVVLFVALAAWYGVGVALAVYGLAQHGEIGLAAFLLGLFYAGLLSLWVLTPVLSLHAGPEAFVDPELYAIYPVSRRTLFGLTLVSAAVQPMAWPLYAALLPPTLASLGWGGGLGRFVAPPLIAALGIVWSAAVSSALIAVTRTRKIREWVAIGGALLLAAAFLLPNFLARFSIRGGVENLAETLSRFGAAGGPESASSIARWVGGLRWTPAGLGASWALDVGSGWTAAAALLLAGAVGLGLAYAALRWSLGRPEATRSRKGVRRASWLTRILRRVPHATGALVFKEVAYMLRDPHLRLAIALPVVLWFLLVLGGDFGGLAALVLLTFITLNAVGQSGTNLLGRDRAGFDAFLAAPLRGRQILLAKALAHLALFAVQFGVLAVLALGFGAVTGTWVALLAAGSAAAALFLLAGGQWFSVTSPYPVDPRRRATGPGGFAVLLLLLVELSVGLILLAAVGLPYLLWGVPGGLGGAVAAVLAGTVVLRAASDRCGLLLESRREQVRSALLKRT